MYSVYSTVPADWATFVLEEVKDFNSLSRYFKQFLVQIDGEIELFSFGVFRLYSFVGDDLNDSIQKGNSAVDKEGGGNAKKQMHDPETLVFILLWIVFFHYQIGSN